MTMAGWPERRGTAVEATASDSTAAGVAATDPAAAELAWICAAARASLLDELNTWPKPGLVSPQDAGAHTDMDATVLEAGIEAITPFYALLARAGAQRAPFARLRAIGLEAERAMLDATGGVNTHRGAIFGLGLLCAAAGRRLRAYSESCEAPGLDHDPPREQTLGGIVRTSWGREISGAPRLPDSHGECVRVRYGAGGARAEAAAGFPAVYDIGVPALLEGKQLAAGDAGAARVQALFRLLSRVQDTNLLHRGGPAGLRLAQEAAWRFLAAGGVGRAGWQGQARSVHAQFVRRRLSPGGCADLLAMSLLCLRLGP
jgi:triphosphoribosyl-dephospho-CoA synthase